MYQEINKKQFHDAFRNMNRGDRFSYHALNTLYDYLIEEEEAYGIQELDVIAICCTYSERELEEVFIDYGVESLSELEASYFVLEVEKEGTVIIGQ